MYKTYSFEDGKYKATRDEATGQIIDITRNGESWYVALEKLQFSKFFHAMLNKIDELEAQF